MRLPRLQPDVLVVLGDRFEMFAAAQAAMVARIPIAPIHGGEATEGVIDEAIRHAVTKMAHLHFVSAEAHRSRVIQMGEDPKHIYTRIPQIDCDFTDLGRGFRYKNQYLAAFLGARSWRTRWVKRIWPPFGSISTAA